MKRKKITIIAICALCMCLFIAEALATATATVYIYANQTGSVKSSKKTLSVGPISGHVASYSSSSSNEALVGKIFTHGQVFEVQRDTASVYAGGSTGLYWSNPNNETGKFDVRIVSPGGHNGICTASN